MTASLKNEKERLEAAASKLLSTALKCGATTAEVVGGYSQKSKITLEKQDYQLASTDDGFSLGLRVMVGKKQGFASTNSLDAHDLKEMAARAVQLAKLSPENPFYSIEPSGNVPADGPTEVWDESLFQLSLPTHKDWTKLMADEAMKDARFRLSDGSVAVSAGLSLVVNSLGTHKTERDVGLHWSIMGMAAEADVITSFDYFSQITRQSLHAADIMVSTARAFRDRVVKGLKQGNSQSYKGLVVFSPRAVLEILVPGILHHVNGRNVAEERGRWRRKDLGTSYLSPMVTIGDSPWLPDRMGFTSFDREGTPTRPLRFLEAGKLTNFALDHYGARALELSSTGHAVGGSSATPSVGVHAPYLSGGDERLSTLLDRTTGQQKEFLMVHRFSGRTDPITGDFSGVAKGGEWWHAGERVYTVKETLISGNIFEVLGTSLFGLSKETEVVDSSEESPTLVCDGVSVTGN